MKQRIQASRFQANTVEFSWLPLMKPEIFFKGSPVKTTKNGDFAIQGDNGETVKCRVEGGPLSSEIRFDLGGESFVFPSPISRGQLVLACVPFLLVFVALRANVT